MVEAMACGTPVIAFSRGAVPEIVQHGITGFIGFSVEELMKYVQQLDKLDPKVIREYTKRKFSSEGMALKYALIYKSMLKS
jgi:glycosyltransferase involved in cell wall biosynthesis